MVVEHERRQFIGREARLHQARITFTAQLVLAREFIGCEWLDWLRKNKLLCRIRVKSNNVVEHRGKKIAIGQLCGGASINQTIMRHSQKESIWSTYLYCSWLNAERIFDRRHH
ncbi:MAG: hypothetical protein QS721_08815 [Candidatus Endonucleobacter sp. (ex Gigantidas childressi)]|nr:hypothetical protein [Candidatus Endonucleobacter sp. (ex Gigantidas childressi)]